MMTFKLSLKMHLTEHALEACAKHIYIIQLFSTRNSSKELAKILYKATSYLSKTVHN